MNIPMMNQKGQEKDEKKNEVEGKDAETGI